MGNIGCNNSWCLDPLTVGEDSGGRPLSSSTLNKQDSCVTLRDFLPRRSLVNVTWRSQVGLEHLESPG